MNNTEILKNLESLYQSFLKENDTENALKTMQEIIALKRTNETKVPANNTSVLLG